MRGTRQPLVFNSPLRPCGYGVLGPAPFMRLGPDVGRVVSPHGEDADGGVEIGFVADQRRGALESSHSDILEKEGAAKEIVLAGVHVEALASVDQARRGGRVGKALADVDGWRRRPSLVLTGRTPNARVRRGRSRWPPGGSSGCRMAPGGHRVLAAMPVPYRRGGHRFEQARAHQAKTRRARGLNTAPGPPGSLRSG